MTLRDRDSNYSALQRRTWESEGIEKLQRTDNVEDLAL